MSTRLAGKILLTVLVIACGVWLGQSRQFYREALVSIFFAATLASVSVIHFRIAPSWSDAIPVLCGTFLFAFIDFQLLHYGPKVASWLSFAGLSSLVILGVRAIWAQGNHRKLIMLGFFPAVLLVVSEYYASDLLQWTSSLHPRVLDLYLYSFDCSLGIQLSFLVGQAFTKSPALVSAGLIFYMGLAIPIGLIYVGRLLRLGQRALPSFIAFLATGPIGVLFYNLFPALGPAHLFLQRFPWHPLSIAEARRLYLEPVAISGPPNAIPSLHMAWVLLCWWYSRGLSWWERAVAFLFLVFTVIGTLGTGEHYFVDLVVAFPFAVLIEALCSFDLSWKNGQRLAGIAGGLLGTLAWLAALRWGAHFFWSSPFIPWVLCLGTVGSMLVLELRLHAQIERGRANDPVQLNPLACTEQT